MRALAEKFFARFHPVVDDAVLARSVVEEAVDVVHDGDVEIEKKGRAAQIAEAIFSHHQFYEHIGPFTSETWIRGERDDANFWIQAGGIFSAAVEQEWTLEVTRDGTIEDVDVIRAIARAPLDAENINGGRLVGKRGGHCKSGWTWCRGERKR